ncbi:MAG: hypothetical protein FJ265_22335, partial [Planctomycetes bacterium]|nr:hypothetical protein [Planctomycetota bacterium]
MTFRAIEDFDPMPAGGKLPGCALPHAPVLLHSEFAADGTHLAIEPQDWRWIALHVGFDLRTHKGGKIATRLPRVPALGDLELTGEATAPDAEGRQHIELQWQVAAPVLEPGEKSVQQAGGVPWFAGSGGGKLALDRRIDLARGAVDELRAALQLDVTFGPLAAGARLAGTFEQRWRQHEVLPHRGEDFARRVDAAIQSAIDPILHELRPGRPEFATRPATKDHHCGEGRMALALQALLAAGHDPADERVQQALADLRARDVRETYSLGTALLAIEQFYAPRGERDLLLAGRLQRPVPREASAIDRERIAEWQQRLLGNRDASVDGAYRSRWWYLGGKGFDNSNSQYALLGLYAAQLCQQPAPRSVWLAAAEHFVAVQQPPQGRLRALVLADTVAVQDQGLAALRAGTGRTVAPRGYNYTLPGAGPAYGSMTAAGLTGLALCAAALDDGKGRPAVLGRIDDALRAGFAWISAHRSVRWNPGPVPRRPEFFFYWLYSLERACELSRVGAIDGWDWYHDGAQVLLALQDANGRFGEATLEEQCFAVLFLKKAQLPARTGL